MANSSEPMNVDEDDELVEEIDVYLQPSMGLNMLQYPLHHTGVPSRCRRKPLHGLTELELPVPSNKIEQKGVFQMPTRKFSSQTVPIQTHLCLAKRTHDNSLVLVPLERIQQMRPSFEHVDEVDEGHVVEEVVNEEDEDQPKPLMFQRKETERAALMRKSSYAYLKASEESEEWIDLKVHAANSPKKKEITDQLAVNTSGPHLSECSTISYLQSLDYNQASNPQTEIQPGKNIVNLMGDDLKTLVAQLTRLLSSGAPVPFAWIQARFPDAPTEHLLRALLVCAVLVQGNFLLNSKYLSMDAAMAKSRTLLLLLLEEYKVVGRRHFSLELLRQVATPDVEGWRLKIAPDPSFGEKHAHEARLYRRYWERQRRRFDLTKYT